MKTPIFFFVFVFLIALDSWAQPAIEWQKTIGGNADDYLTCIHQTKDGGYIIGGTSNSGISGIKSEPNLGFGDYWVVKLDAAGNISWQKTIGGDGFDNLTSIIETENGYLVGGYSSSGIGGDKTEANIGDDFWIVKLSLSGSILWQNTISGDNSDHLESIQSSPDGNFILGGSSSSGIGYDKSAANCTSGTQDYWLVVIDSLGNVQLDFTLGGDAYDFLKSIYKTADEGYIIIGSSNSTPSCNMTDGTSDGIYYNWIVKINSSGSVEWDSVFTAPGGGLDQYPGNIIQTTDGGFAFVSLGNTVGYAYKLSPSGTIEWVTASNDTGFVYVSPTEDAGYIIAMEIYYGLRKLDSTGNIIWEDIFTGNNSDHLTAVAQAMDKGFILGGSSASDSMNDKTENSYGLQDFWIVKTMADTLLATSANEIFPENNGVSLFPNPIVDKASFNYSIDADVISLKLYDPYGRMVQSFINNERREKGSHTTQLEFSELPVGMYFLVLTGGSTFQVIKLVKETD